MARIIGIDYGLSRVGLAVTDRSGVVPLPLKTIPSAELIQFLQDYIGREDVEKIILTTTRTAYRTNTNLNSPTRL